MGFRQRRVSDELRVQLAELLMHEIKDPRLGFVTVTEVRVSPDLSHARVFISILGGEDEEQSALEALGSAKGFLRREIGRRVRLRHTPELHFEVDRTLDHSDRIEELLLEAALPEQDADAAEGEAPEVEEAAAETTDAEGRNGDD
jgi:ribosome-binding factor A